MPDTQVPRSDVVDALYRLVLATPSPASEILALYRADAIGILELRDLTARLQASTEQ